MKKILALVLVLVTLLGFAGCERRGYDSREVKKEGKLVVGVTEFKPMNYKEDGEWTGFDTEFATLFAKEKLGVDVEFVEIVWDDRFDILNDYKIDCIWNGMTITEYSKEKVSVSKAYLRNAQILVTKVDKADGYKDGYDIRDISFAVEKGSAAEECLVRSGYKGIVRVESQLDALKAAESGDTDAAVVDITLANVMVGKDNAYSNLAKVFEFSSETYGVGFRKGSDLTQLLNEYISEIWDEEMLSLANKYGLTLV